MGKQYVSDRHEQHYANQRGRPECFPAHAGNPSHRTPKVVDQRLAVKNDVPDCAHHEDYAKHLMRDDPEVSGTMEGT